MRKELNVNFFEKLLIKGTLNTFNKANRPSEVSPKSDYKRITSLRNDYNNASKPEERKTSPAAARTTLTRAQASALGFKVFEVQDRDGKPCYMLTRYEGYETSVHFPEYVDNLPVRIIDACIFERKNYETDKWEMFCVEEVFIPKTVILVKERAFMDCAALRKVHFEGEIPEIQPTAFLRCCSLENPPENQQEIKEPWRKPESYDTKSPTTFDVERIAGRNAVRIKKINSYRSEVRIPEKIDGMTVAEISAGVPHERDERRRNFGNHTLKTLWIPDCVEKIGGSAFMKCWGLESIRLPNNPSLIICEDGFWGCENLDIDKVVFPQGKSYLDYANAFGGCDNLKAGYQRKMREEYKRKKREEFERKLGEIRQTDESVEALPEGVFAMDDGIEIISENSPLYSPEFAKLGYHTIVLPESLVAVVGYRLFYRFENIVILNDNVSFLPGKTCNYLNVHGKCRLIFKDGENEAVIPLVNRFGRYLDKMAVERKNHYESCIGTRSGDGKFFDTHMYDERIMELLPSMRSKFDVCYHRLKNSYRISPEHTRMYSNFLHKHYKKAAYQAIDTHDKERLEQYFAWGVVRKDRRGYNAILEYAKRKGALDMFDGIDDISICDEYAVAQSGWVAFKVAHTVNLQGELDKYHVSQSTVYRRVIMPDGKEKLMHKDEEYKVYDGDVTVDIPEPKLKWEQTVYSKKDRKFAKVGDIYWDNYKCKMLYAVDIKNGVYYYENFVDAENVSQEQKDGLYCFAFAGFDDWRDFSVIVEVVKRCFSPDEINVDCITEMNGYFIKDGVRIGVSYLKDCGSQLSIDEKTADAAYDRAYEIINSVWRKCVEIMIERQG